MILLQIFRLESSKSSVLWSHLFSKILRRMLPCFAVFPGHPVTLDQAHSEPTHSDLPMSSFSVCHSLSLVSYVVFRIHASNPEGPHLETLPIRTSANSLAKQVYIHRSWRLEWRHMFWGVTSSRHDSMLLLYE